MEEQDYQDVRMRCCLSGEELLLRTPSEDALQRDQQASEESQASHAEAALSFRRSVMEKKQSEMSQGWVMYHLGLLAGQEANLLDKTTSVIALHDKVRAGEVDPAELNTLVGLEELVEMVKKFQNNASMLMAYVLMWRRDWKGEHEGYTDAPKPILSKPEGT